MLAALLAGFMMVLIAARVPAQQAFDVASVRQNLAPEDTQGPDKPRVNFPIGSDDAFYNTGGVFSAVNLPLSSYVIFAFKINNNNRAAMMESLPEWAKSEHYNIEARTDLPNVTKDQMRTMMQTLLRDRFHLVVRRSTEEVRVYAAVLDKPGVRGPQLRPDGADRVCPIETAKSVTAQPTFDGAGFPQVCGRFIDHMLSAYRYHRRFGGAGLPLNTIVASFSALAKLDRPVVNQTGMMGDFDFVLDYLPEPEAGHEWPADVEGPGFMQALKEQLGLKLVDAKAPIEFVRVEHIEHPTAN